MELHRSASEWRTHGHQRDPHYNGVILHVVLSSRGRPAQTSARRTVPVLVLSPLPDAFSRTALFPAANSAVLPRLPCRGVNTALPPAELRRWIGHLAAERLELKIDRFRERLRELASGCPVWIGEPRPLYHGNPDDIPAPSGMPGRREVTDRRLWEQLLYEGIAEAMGYEKNEAPFARLSRAVPLAALRAHGLGDSETVSALLFGAAGLLPPVRSAKDRETRSLLRSLRHDWRRLRKEVRPPRLHEGEWKFFRLRPANFPTARLAALCRLLPRLCGDHSFRELVMVFKEELTAAKRRRKLERLFTDRPEGYWERRYRFGPPSRRNAAGLGSSRIAAIIVNVILPVMLLYARIFSDGAVARNVRTLLLHLPPDQGNRVTRRMESDLLKGRAGSAYMLQGLLQLHHDYCSIGRCADCEIGKSVRNRYPEWALSS